MHWELWALNSGNLLADFDAEARALDVVRELVANGWRTNDLGLRLEWDDGEEGDDADLPPVRYGETLAQVL